MHNTFFFNGLTVYPDSLPKVSQMGRGEQSRAVSMSLQDCSQHMGDRTLAVCSCNMDHFAQTTFGVMDETAQGLYAIQSLAISCRSDPMKHGQLLQ